MDGEALILDGDVDRKNKCELFEYLKTKYGLEQIMDIDVGHHYAEYEG